MIGSIEIGNPLTAANSLGSGDVTEVWNAFAETFDWVAGVAGNHDTFGSRGEDPFKPKLPKMS